MQKSGPTGVSESIELMAKAQKLLAYGGLDGVVQRPLLDQNGSITPQFIVAADGYRITDVSGQQLIDWVNGWGPVLLGYRHPVVEQAIANQMTAGPTLSLMHPIEIEVAELIVDLVPGAEKVAFAKNGSDAVNAAIRIARAATGREMVLQSGFHGFHEWYTCLHKGVQGILPIHRDYVRSFEYNDLQGFEQLLNEFEGQVAAVVMEPVNMWMPQPGYLESIRAMTEKHGIILVFDEIVTAFRLAKGGAQEYFNVVPDITCLAKGMANGMPLSAVAGSRKLMELLPRCGFGLTFRGETLSLAAAKATLEIIRDEPVTETIAFTGRKLRDGFENLCRKHDITAALSGPDARMTFVFNDQNGVSWQTLRTSFLQHCLSHGVLTNGNLLPSYAHDDLAVDETLEVFDGALKCLSEVINDEPGARDSLTVQVAGFMDKLELLTDGIRIGGWILLNQESPDLVEVHVLDEDSELEVERLERDDIKKAFSDSRDSLHSGFQCLLPADLFQYESEIQLRIVASAKGRPVFQCVVKLSRESQLHAPLPLAKGFINAC